MEKVDTIIPIDPNHILLHNAALTARARRKHHSTPRIRHWLEDVLERKDLPSDSSDNGIEIYNDDNGCRSPSLENLTRFRDSIHFHASRHGSLVELRLPEDFSRASTALNSKPSKEKMYSSSCSSSSGPSFGTADPTTLLPPPRLMQALQTQKDKMRSKPKLTIKVHKSPYRTRYTITRQRVDGTPKTQSPHGKRNKSRLVAPAVATGTVCGFPCFETYEFPSPPMTGRKTGVRCTPPPSALRGRFATRKAIYVPPAIEVPSPSTRNKVPLPFPVFVKTSTSPTTDNMGAKNLKLPRMPNDVNKLRLMQARMAKQSDRMLVAALQDRGTELTVQAGAVADHRAMQRKVLNEAQGNKLSANKRMNKRDRKLGFKPAGQVRRDWAKM